MTRGFLFFRKKRTHEQIMFGNTVLHDLVTPKNVVYADVVYGMKIAVLW